MKKILGVALTMLALPWIVCMLSLIPIAIHTSCISDEFLAREGLSFWLLPGFIFGPAFGIGILVDAGLEKDEEVKP
jgi:hypothetical protein